MLQNKYLPTFHFAEKHQINIHSSPQKISFNLTRLDLSQSRLIRFLFFLRGLPLTMMTLEGLGKGKFKTLEIINDQELIIGLIGRFWIPAGDLQDFVPSDFISVHHPGFAKATWNFRLVPHGTDTLLETETRIFCADEKSRKKFARYWFFIRPFSGIIRKEILKSIKRKAELN